MALSLKIIFIGATASMSASEIMVGKTTNASLNVSEWVAYAAVPPPMQAIITSRMGIMPKRFDSQFFQNSINGFCLDDVFVFSETITWVF